MMDGVMKINDQTDINSTGYKPSITQSSTTNSQYFYDDCSSDRYYSYRRCSVIGKRNE